MSKCFSKPQSSGGRSQMARSHVSLLVATLLIVSLTLGASCYAASQQEFRNINCGGEAYRDPNTTLSWDADPFNEGNDELLYGKVGKVNKTANVFTTLRYFPYDLRNRKLCYSFEVSYGSKYLLRASFLYGNYDGKNQPPTFVLIFNYDILIDVNTTYSTIPIVHELIFTSSEDEINICLARRINSRHIPFISTLELRLLEDSMYNVSSDLANGYGLMVWRRINYGAKTNLEIRYPDDRFDRIWEANTTGPTVSTITNNVGQSNGSDVEQPPREVMATAITTNSSTEKLSFTYDGFEGVGGRIIELHFQEVDQTLQGQSQRNIEITIAGGPIFNAKPSFARPELIHYAYHTDCAAPLQCDAPLQVTLVPVADSPRGPLLNAVELFHWTPQPLHTSGTFYGDVDTIKAIQTHFKLKGYGQGDPCMPKYYSWTWISCNEDIEPRITEINLARFNLTGDIPPSINNLTTLRKLDLSDNKLSGQIPDVSLLLDLEFLDLHSNALIGELPPSLYSLSKLAFVDVSYNGLCETSNSFQIWTHSNFSGNTGGCDCLKSAYTSMLEKEKKKTRKYVFATCFLGALYTVTMLILLAIHMARHNRKIKETSSSTLTGNKKGVQDPKSLPFVTRVFTYNEIKNATLNFTTLLGEGGFGKVYHGLLTTTGEAIAVKMLENTSKQGLKEFYNEVAILSRVRHKNLVSLIGYCVENTYMLIYEYISKGNLRNLLYGELEHADRPLPWTTRLHIALGASQGLEYLHIGCDSTIIHRDVKSSNILLTHKMQAKVADFGLSRLKEEDNANSHVSTINVAGTIGYLDPAYYATNQFTDKSDVYSFGIVLFELICGRAPIDMVTSLPHIVDWVTPAIMQDKVGDIVDPSLENGYKEESMRKVVDMAFSCVNRDRMKRPTMRQVSQLLQNALEVEMDQQDFSPQLEDLTGESSSTTNGQLPGLQYIETLSTINLDPCKFLP